MANPDIVFDLAAPDPGFCPDTTADLYNDIKEKATVTMPGDYIPYVTGTATPATEDQDKVWHRTDADGRPIGTYVYYSGAWRREYTGKIGEVVMYSGDPDVDFAESGGRGTVGGEWDGWQLCNGQNGSANLSDKFVIGAKMDDLGIGYENGDGPWKTNVTGSPTQEGAGNTEITLTDETTFRKPVEQIKLGQWTADGNAAGTSLYGLVNNDLTDVIFQAADAGNETPDPITVIPPYYALAFAVFVGYD